MENKSLSEFFEIAYAAASNRLCLFTGTGFSKAVTDSDAPSWVDLLKEICQLLPNKDSIIQDLFPSDAPEPLSLEEAAQVIEIELQKNKQSIYEEIEKIINKLSLKGDNTEVESFLKENVCKIITTNYDKLVEELVGLDVCHSISPGLSIPRSQSKTKVYHIHGSVDSSSNMIVTSNDYFNFINEESYFSRKLSTLLHENTVVILGYSLSDTNLKAIINSYKRFSNDCLIESNIFFVSRSSISQCIKDYYSYCYGIRVIDNTDIHEFFKLLNEKMPSAKDLSDQSKKEIKNAVEKGSKYEESYIRMKNSFFEIIPSIDAQGFSKHDPRVIRVIGEIIEKKVYLTGENGAWEQYEHLADWLIYLGSVLEMEHTAIEKIYLHSVLRSMNTMSNKLFLGYSWQAYQFWVNKWSNIKHSNRILIKTYIEEHSNHLDALSLVERF